MKLGITGPRLICAYIILMLAFFLAVAVFSLTLFVIDKVNKPDRIAPEKLKATMLYHGVQYAECDWKDRCYFYRDGKRLKI